MISLKSLLTEGTLNEDIKKDIDKFIDKLNKQFPDQEYTVSSGGGKYVRINHKSRKFGGESAWGFIALVDNPSKGFQKGDLLKAAGYNTPAKHARGNILNGTAKYDKYSPTYLKEESINEGGLYHIGYNKGRGQGKGVFKDSYSSYKEAKKEVEKLEKQRGGSYNMTAYYVADKDGNFVKESVNEGNWSKIMAGVKKGSQSGPWTIVIIQNKKVIHQEPVKYRDAIPAHYESMKREFRNASLAIEDKTGQIVYSEKI